MTLEELALLGIHSGAGIPSGGERLVVRVASGSGSAAVWTTQFQSAIRKRFGVGLHPGSLNLWADDPVLWHEPLPMNVGAVKAEFCPLVLEEAAIGLAFRGNADQPCFLEVFSPVALRRRLGGLTDGQTISVRLLSGRDFASSA